MKQYNYSYSMLRSFNEYLRGSYCGLLFKALYIEKSVSIEATDAMRAGQYLEYILTGATLRDGSAPEPELTKAGKMTAMYERMHEYVPLWQKILKQSGIIPDSIQTSVLMQTEIAGYTLKGIADVVAKTVLDEIVIIDIKSSGFIRNKWEDYGWEELEKKRQLWSQLAMYDFLHEKTFSIKANRLLFAVFNPSGYDARLFNVNITNRDVADYERHYTAQIENCENEIQFADETFWRQSRDFRQCMNCPLRESCDVALYAPAEETVNVSMIYPPNY